MRKWCILEFDATVVICFPLRGIRYKCLGCFDYNLCTGCQRKGIHSQHEMYIYDTRESDYTIHYLESETARVGIHG